MTNQNFYIFDDLPHSEMVYIPAGSFMMGHDESFRPDEKPAYPVTIHQPFWLGKCPVTQALWKRVMDGLNPSYFKADNRPVEKISWEDITNEFLPKINTLTNKVFTLPSEAQWEYAARGGDTTELLYAGSNELEEVAWYEGNSPSETQPVGLKKANGFGLFDMSGNVWEWCEDDHLDYMKPNRPKDEKPLIASPYRTRTRILRGGSFSFAANCCSVFYKYNGSFNVQVDNTGFRLALAIS